MNGSQSNLKLDSAVQIRLLALLISSTLWSTSYNGLVLQACHAWGGVRIPRIPLTVVIDKSFIVKKTQLVEYLSVKQKVAGSTPAFY